MARALFYPKADTKAQWFGGNSTMSGISKLLLHSTETGTWPGYGGGGSSPTLTYHAAQHTWRQHMKLNESARALRDPSGTVVRENRDNIVQVEIIGTCDWQFAARYGYPLIAELDNQALDDLGEFAAFLNREWGLPLTAAPLWLPYRLPNGSTYGGSYGDSRARMSGEEFDRFTGILGHQHASGNTHGDPGDINVDRILATARRLAGGTSTPSTATGALIVTDDDAKKIEEIVERVLLRVQAQGRGTDWRQEGYQHWIIRKLGGKPGRILADRRAARLARNQKG